MVDEYRVTRDALKYSAVTPMNPIKVLSSMAASLTIPGPIGFIFRPWSKNNSIQESDNSSTNAGGVHNLTIDVGESDHSDLMRRMGNGLLVTEVMGQGVNLVTGDYSRGASGFWIENGQIRYPVEEITIAGNLREIYKNIAAVGNDVDLRGNIRTGSILIEEMTVAGSMESG